MKTTHLAIAAHQDDIEIMAQHGILTCFDDPTSAFSAVVCSDGAGSPRSGIYKDFTDEQMKRIRITEQEKAAKIGNYHQMIFLKFESSRIKDGKDRELVEKIKNILKELRPKVIYTHNPTDKHDTHVAVSLRVIAALKEICDDENNSYRPEKVLGCEVWRGLDWINDDEKIALDVSGHPAIRAALLGVFDSQIAGGKRYDLAAQGRFATNATFYASHNTDKSDAISYAVDLLPLIDGGDVYAYMKGLIDRFAEDVKEKMGKVER